MTIEEMEQLDKAKTKILKYILYKKRSEGEIRNKFSGTIEENLLDDAIEYLKEAGYINDKEYIKKTVNEWKTLKNLSQKEIQFKLLSKGLNKEDIEDYMSENREELENFEIKSAEDIIYKKESSKEAEEIIQYLLKKGYKMDIIKKAIEEE